MIGRLVIPPPLSQSSFWHTLTVIAVLVIAIILLSVALWLQAVRRRREKNLLSAYTALSDGSQIPHRYERISAELYHVHALLFLPNSREYLFSPAGKGVFGLPEDKERLSVQEFCELIHPEELPAFRVFEASLEGDVAPATGMELRLLTADGTFHWYMLRFRLLENNQEGPVFGGALMDITREKEKDLIIERMTYTDELTGLYNRNRFIAIGQKIHLYAHGSGEGYWLLNLDLDKFQLFNSLHGYEAGNTLLRATARIIMESVPPGSTCARIGSDSFGVLYRGHASPCELISTIQAGLANANFDFCSSLPLTLSAGYCRVPEDGESFIEAFERAEFSLRSAKLEGAAVRRYDDRIQKLYVGQSQLERELRSALLQQQLSVYFQPIIDLRSGRLAGMEALTRWFHPSGRIVPPDEFIPVAESSHLILDLSRYVLSEACRQNARWQAQGMSPVSVAINLTAADFYQTDVCETIRNILDDAGLSPYWVEVELTESLALQNVERAIEQMERLRELGVRISLDDFGTGYSSLSYFQRLPVDRLKLDRSFIIKMEGDEVSREIVFSVIRIARSKRVKTIAEGVETPEQAKILRYAGCDYAQGYLFGRPVDANEFEANFSKEFSLLP